MDEEDGEVTGMGDEMGVGKREDGGCEVAVSGVSKQQCGRRRRRAERALQKGIRWNDWMVRSKRNLGIWKERFDAGGKVEGSFDHPRCQKHNAQRCDLIEFKTLCLDIATDMIPAGYRQDTDMIRTVDQEHPHARLCQVNKTLTFRSFSSILVNCLFFCGAVHWHTWKLG